MVQDAEKYKDEDDKLRKKIDAKNGLESFIFQMKATLTDEKFAGKFDDETKTKIEGLATDGLQFLESNTEASADEFEAKQKEIEAVWNPIMQKMYQETGGMPGGEGMPGGMPDMSGAGAGGATAPDAGDVNDLD